MSICCKHCNSNIYVKNGFVFNKQRYRCKSCGYNFVDGDKRVRYHTSDHLKVIKLYLENCGIRTIERLTGIHNSQISQWISEAADNIRSQLQKSMNSVNSIEDIEILEIDELCTYIKKDLKTEENSPSYGLLLIGTEVKLLTLR